MTDSDLLHQLKNHSEECGCKSDGGKQVIQYAIQRIGELLNDVKALQEHCRNQCERLDDLEHRNDYKPHRLA